MFRSRNLILIFALLPFLAFSQGKKISDLTAGTPATNDVMEYETSGGSSRHTTITNLLGNNESAIDHNDTTNGAGNQHLDWTQDQGATDIHSGNYTDSTLSDAQVESAYNTQVPAASQAEMEAGTEAAIRRMSPLRVAQAIAALGSSAAATDSGFASYMSASSSTQATGTWLKLPMDTEVKDQGNNYDNTLYRYTPDREGFHVLSASAYVSNASIIDDRLIVAISKNGVPGSGGTVVCQSYGESSDGNTVANVMCVDYAEATDYYEAYGNQQSGSTIAFSSSSSATYFQGAPLHGGAVPASLPAGWTTYDASDSWTSDADVTGTFAYYAHGPLLYIRARLDLTGAPPNSGLTFDLPSGYELDTDTFSIASNVDGGISQVFMNESGVATNQARIRATDSNSLEVEAFNDDGTYEGWTELTATTPFTWGTGDKIIINAMIPLSSGVIPGNISDWTAYTPTLGWTSNASGSCYYKTIGSDELKARCTITTTGAPAGGSLTVSLPSGFAIDTTKMLDNSTTGFVVGDLYLRTSGGSDRLGIMVTNNSGTTLRAAWLSIITGGNNDPIDYATLTSTSPVTIGSGDKVNIDFSVPIQ